MAYIERNGCKIYAAGDEPHASRRDIQLQRWGLQPMDGASRAEKRLAIREAMNDRRAREIREKDERKSAISARTAATVAALHNNQDWRRRHHHRKTEDENFKRDSAYNYGQSNEEIRRSITRSPLSSKRRRPLYTHCCNHCGVCLRNADLHYNLRFCPECGQSVQ